MAKESELWWDLVKVGFGLISGAAIPLLVEWLRRWLYGPCLEVVHADGERFMPLTKEPGRSPGEFPTKYLRVCVKNIGGMAAIGCRAYLINIEEIVDGQPTPTFYWDTLRLRWAYEEEGELHEGIDIPPGIHMYFDVLSTKYENDHNTTLIQVAKLRYNFVNKLNFNTDYLFTILVAAEATVPVQISLVVRLGATWKELSVTDQSPLLIKGKQVRRRVL